MGLRSRATRTEAARSNTRADGREFQQQAARPEAGGATPGQLGASAGEDSEVVQRPDHEPDSAKGPDGMEVITHQ